MTATTYDVASLALAWAKSVTGLVGGDSGLVGVHLTDDLRSPGRGSMANLRVSGTSTVDVEGLGHTVSITFEVKAGGRGAEEGAKAAAERGARALATEIRKLTGAPVAITAKDGTRARLLIAYGVQGPLDAGQVGGQATSRVTAMFVFSDPAS